MAKIKLKTHVGQHFGRRFHEFYDFSGSFGRNEGIFCLCVCYKKKKKEFLTFYLKNKQVAIDLVMQEKGLNKTQFQRATKAALRGQNDKKKIVTQLQIDILFTLFDADGDGQLSPKEFIHVMQKRKDGGFNQPRDTGAFELLKIIYIFMFVGVLKDLSEEHNF